MPLFVIECASERNGHLGQFVVWETRKFAGLYDDCKAEFVWFSIPPIIAFDSELTNSAEGLTDRDCGRCDLDCAISSSGRSQSTT